VPRGSQLGIASLRACSLTATTPFRCAAQSAMSTTVVSSTSSSFWRLAVATSRVGAAQPLLGAAAGGRRVGGSACTGVHALESPALKRAAERLLGGRVQPAPYVSSAISVSSSSTSIMPSDPSPLTPAGQGAGVGALVDTSLTDNSLSGSGGACVVATQFSGARPRAMASGTNPVGRGARAPPLSRVSLALPITLRGFSLSPAAVARAPPCGEAPREDPMLIMLDGTESEIDALGVDPAGAMALGWARGESRPQSCSLSSSCPLPCSSLGEAVVLCSSPDRQGAGGTRRGRVSPMNRPCSVMLRRGMPWSRTFTRRGGSSRCTGTGRDGGGESRGGGGGGRGGGGGNGGGGGGGEADASGISNARDGVTGGGVMGTGGGGAALPWSIEMARE